MSLCKSWGQAPVQVTICLPAWHAVFMVAVQVGNAIQLCKRPSNVWNCLC